MTNNVEGCIKKHDGGGGGYKGSQNSMTSFMDDPPPPPPPPQSYNGNQSSTPMSFLLYGVKNIEENGRCIQKSTRLPSIPNQWSSKELSKLATVAGTSSYDSQDFSKLRNSIPTISHGYGQ